MTKFSSKRRLSSGISVASMVLALAIAQPAHAQTTSSIRGEGATPGSTISATDTVTGQTATTTVNADGTFVIVGLRPSTYRVTGAGEAQDVVLPVGQTVTIDVAPPAAAAGSGAIVVTGRRNRQEVRSATVGTSVSQMQIENLPQNDRNFLNFAALAPGVTVLGGATANNKRIQAGGVSADNVNVYVDGTSHKNQVGFNGIAGQNFSQGNPFPQLAVQEFRVESQNYKAEYEQAGSAIITAITKTGGQEFHGDAFVELMPKSWFGRPFFDRPGERNNMGFPCPDDPSETCYTPKPDFRRWQFGGDLGGPIMPEKLHFFVAYEGNRQANPSASFNLVTQDTAADLGLDVSTTATNFKQDLYFGKLSGFLTDADTVHGSVFIRTESDVRDFGGERLRENGRDLHTTTKNFQVEWNHRASDWLNEALIGYFDSYTGTPRLLDSSEYVLTGGIWGPHALIFGGRDFEQSNQQKNWNFRNNFTYTGFDGHVVKAGVRFSKTKLMRLEDAFGLGSYRFDVNTFTDVDTSIPYAAQIQRNAPPVMTAKNDMLGIFIQDDWTVNEHLTINAGIRWDYESNNFNQDYVTPDNIATGLRNYVGWQAAGIDPEDYISDGNNRDPFYGAFQPRIGISYDVFGDRDLIFFAGAGRYYDRNNFYLASLETLFGRYRSDVTINFCGATGLPNCTGAANELVWNEAYRDPDALREALPEGLGGWIFVLNNDTPVPYTDQFNIGVRKRFGDWQTSATIAHNRSHNGFIFVRGNRMPNGEYTPDGFAYIRDNFPPEGQVPGFSGRLYIGSSEGEARYTALYLQAEKPWTDESQWGSTLALTISRAESNQAKEYGGAEMWNAGEQTAYGWQRVYGLEDWRFVGTGIVGLPLGLRGSATVTLASGPRYGAVSFDNQPCGGCIPFNEAGVYSPPGKIPYKAVDVRLAKIFKMPWSGHELTADFQVYNLFDWVNKTYGTWSSGPPDFNPEGTTGNARSFQAGLKYSF